MTGRGVKHTPIYAQLQHLNAKLGERSGWQVAESIGSLESQIAAARSRLALADESANGKIFVEGEAVEAAVQRAFGVGGLTVHGGRAFAGGHVYRLRGDIYFVHTPPGGESAAVSKLSAAVDDSQLVTPTEVTHGCAELRLVGRGCAALLSKLCALDFADREFPDGSAKQSSLAKTPQLIIRKDVGGLPSYAMIGPRSLGAYVWDAIMVAGGEWGIAPVGAAAIDSMEK